MKKLYVLSSIFLISSSSLCWSAGKSQGWERDSAKRVAQRQLTKEKKNADEKTPPSGSASGASETSKEEMDPQVRTRVEELLEDPEAADKFLRGTLGKPSTESQELAILSGLLEFPEKTEQSCRRLLDAKGDERVVGSHRAQLFVTLGSVLSRQLKITEAARAYMDSLAFSEYTIKDVVNGAQRPPFSFLLDLLQFQGKIEVDVGVYQELLSRKGDHGKDLLMGAERAEVLNYYARVLAARERYEEAKKTYREILQSNPHLPQDMRAVLNGQIKALEMKIRRSKKSSNRDAGAPKSTPDSESQPEKQTKKSSELSEEEKARNKEAVRVRDEAAAFVDQRRYQKAIDVLAPFLDNFDPKAKKAKTVKQCERMLAEARVEREKQLQRNEEKKALRKEANSMAEEARKQTEKESQEKKERKKQEKDERRKKKKEAKPTNLPSVDVTASGKTDLAASEKSTQSGSSPAAASLDKDDLKSQSISSEKSHRLRAKLQRTPSARGLAISSEARAAIHHRARLAVREGVENGKTLDAEAFKAAMEEKYGPVGRQTAADALAKASFLGQRSESIANLRVAKRKGSIPFTAKSDRRMIISSVEDMALIAEKGLPAQEVTSRLGDIFHRLTSSAPHSKDTWKEGDFDLKRFKGIFRAKINNQHRVFFSVDPLTHHVTILQVGEHDLKKGHR